MPSIFLSCQPCVVFWHLCRSLLLRLSCESDVCLSACAVNCDFGFSAGSDLHPCNCPDRQLKDTCLWIQSLECDVFKMDMPYQMRMIAENELKKVYSRLFKFETTNLGTFTCAWHLLAFLFRCADNPEICWSIEVFFMYLNFLISVLPCHLTFAFIFSCQA